MTEKSLAQSMHDSMGALASFLNPSWLHLDQDEWNLLVATMPIWVNLLMAFGGYLIVRSRKRKPH